MCTENKEKWRSEWRWIESIDISFKKPYKTKYHYYIPKTVEEEKKMVNEWNSKVDPIYNELFEMALHEPASQ